MFGKDKNKQDEPAPTRGGDSCGDECDCSGSDAGAGAASGEVQQLKQQIEELNSKYLRTVADYQNVARRSVKDAEDARYQGMKSVVQNILTVLDHFDLALSQDMKKASAEQIVGG